MRKIASGRTDRGRDRALDGDDHALVPKLELHVVVDGLGGDGKATRLAIETFADFFQMMADDSLDWPFPGDPDLSEEEDWVATGLRLANRRLFDREVRAGVPFRATCVIACYAPLANRLSLGRVGDCRAYRVRGGSVEVLTAGTAHPSPSRRVSQEKNARFPWELGAHDEVVVNLVSDTPQPGDVYLLCSGRLSRRLTDAQMLGATSSSADTDEIGRRLVAGARDKGAEDDLTTLVIAFAEPASETVDG